MTFTINYHVNAQMWRWITTANELNLANLISSLWYKYETSNSAFFQQVDQINWIFFFVIVIHITKFVKIEPKFTSIYGNCCALLVQSCKSWYILFFVLIIRWSRYCNDLGQTIFHKSPNFANVWASTDHEFTAVRKLKVCDSLGMLMLYVYILLKKLTSIKLNDIKDILGLLEHLVLLQVLKTRL